ncbi:hypothetical protein O3G_MSEX006928 [Manduca sexta]|uniref:Uncharacterized protein n=1 Tax=Manduca sexta TaxID=7130 RepID=A0A922CM68_MANSE|nr:hypothetical protein O3G_MSEX006928 [Manduca sexta]
MFKVGFRTKLPGVKIVATIKFFQIEHMRIHNGHVCSVLRRLGTCPQIEGRQLKTQGNYVVRALFLHLRVTLGTGCWCYATRVTGLGNSEPGERHVDVARGWLRRQLAGQLEGHVGEQGVHVVGVSSRDVGSVHVVGSGGSSLAVGRGQHTRRWWCAAGRGREAALPSVCYGTVIRTVEVHRVCAQRARGSTWKKKARRKEETPWRRTWNQIPPGRNAS